MRHDIFVSDEAIALEVHFKSETEFVVYDLNSAETIYEINNR